MKATTKKILIVLMLVSILIAGFISISEGATTITPNDSGKKSAVLNKDNKLKYYDYDIGRYNNLYCVQHSQALESKVGSKGITLSSSAMVEIVGDTATFYKFNSESGQWEQFKDPIVNVHSNLLAGIVAEEKPNDVITPTEMKKLVETKNKDYDYDGMTYKSSTHKIYRGYGGFDSGIPEYTVTQIALWREWNNWIEALNVKTGYGFYTDASNEKLKGVSKWKRIVADEYITQLQAKIASEGTIYSTRIYMLKSGSTLAKTVQELIIVDPKLNIPVTKIWDDKADSSNRTEITIKLFADGKDTGKTLKLNSGNKWKGMFSNLEQNDSEGNEITYTIQEVSVPGYDSSTPSGSQTTGFTITNTLKTKDISVTKNWYDDNNADGIRPTAITVNLYQNDKIIKTAVLNEENNWTVEFKGLPEYKDGKTVTYTVKEDNVPEGYIQIIEKTSNDFTITNLHEVKPDGYVEITGKVWHDSHEEKPNDINGTLEKGEPGIEGIKVILKDANGTPISSTYTDKDGKFTRTDYALTKSDGSYTIRVNYDNSNSVYKLYEDAATVAEKLKTAYVEFEYDAVKYTTVKTATSGANTSKAKENETARNVFDGKYGTVTPTTDANVLKNEKITASTQGIISFETYTDKTTQERSETTRYCNGNGTHIRTNPNGAWLDIIRDEINDKFNHPETCSNQVHTLKTQELEVGIIQNVNLGLFDREKPDVAIWSDLSKVQVKFNKYEYTYLYNIDTERVEEEAEKVYKEKYNYAIKQGMSKEAAKEYAEEYKLKVKFQNKYIYTYKRPINPANIVAVNDGRATMDVYVTYEIQLGNKSTTLPVTINSITNYYDLDYELLDESNDEYEWVKVTGTGSKFNVADGTVNIELAPGEVKKIEVKYKINQEAIKGLLTEDATLNNAVEIKSYSTKYGKNTLYAEQRTGGRTGNAYGGYDNNSHPGNANIDLSTDKDGIERLYSLDGEGKILPIMPPEKRKVEDDTDIAPAFLLQKDTRVNRILSGNVWEDLTTKTKDGYRLGDGKKAKNDKNVENVKVQLYTVKEDGTLEPAKVYKIGEDGQIFTQDAVATTDKHGNYSFGESEGFSVATDMYMIKFTYGDARNYKSTIISKDNNALYNLFADKNYSSEEWYLGISKGYSIAVDDMEERVKISDLQYSNFGDKLYITAESKPFAVKIEADGKVESNVVDENGLIDKFSKEIAGFDFGIAERAREDIFVETIAEYIKVTLANGQILTEGDPRVDELNYAKPIGFNQNINNGAEARKALEKQVLIEVDTELLQGAQLEVKYGIEVTNNSEKDIDYYVDGQYKTEYYYFGSNNEGSPEISSSVDYVVDYLDSELTYTWENANDWTQKTADELLNEDLISEATYNIIKEKDYATYITTKFSNLKPGESRTDHVTAKKLLANQDENVYDNHAEILKIDAKTARTIKQPGITKEYKMGNYVPSLATRVINNDVDREEAGLHEQDDDRLKIVITPPTGTTNYIITYVATALIGLIVVAIVTIFIKKKLVNK